jgi:hypothetical protein
MKRIALLLPLMVASLFGQTLHTVTLNWKWVQGTLPDGTPGGMATNFNIKRSTVAGACLATPPTAACTVIASPSLAVSATAVTGTYQYVDSGAALTTGTTFFYVVTAANSAGDSAPTNQDSELIPPFAVSVPSAPTALVGKSQ